MTFDVESYGLFFAAVAREIILRGAKRAHPRLQILGLLEARLIDVDVMLLGGLDETVWPPQARTDAFLNRPCAPRWASRRRSANSARRRMISRKPWAKAK